MKNNTLKKKTLKKKPLQNKKVKTKRKYNKRKTQKKNNFSKKRVYRKSNKKSLKKQKGGASNDDLLDILLCKEVIKYLPTSQIFEYEKLNKYLQMVDIYTLKDIVLENKNYVKSPSIQRIFNYTSEELEDPKNIQLEPEDINCESLIDSRNLNMKKLFIQLFECNIGMYVKKDVEWIKVVCGLEDFDATYEYICSKSIVDKGIYLKKEDIIDILENLSEDIDFKLILKKRLYNCSKQPRTFLENIFGGVSFPSYKGCDKANKKGVLYLYDEYKRFLVKENGIDKLDKIKVLLFCETRLHELSKYVSLEMLRISDKKYGAVKSILDNLFKIDREIIKENDKKLFELNKNKNSSESVENLLSKTQDKTILSEEEIAMQELDNKRLLSEEENNSFTNNENVIQDKMKQVGGASFNLSGIGEISTSMPQGEEGGMFSNIGQEEQVEQTPQPTSMFSNVGQEEPTPPTSMFSNVGQEEQVEQTPQPTSMFSNVRQEESESTPETSEMNDDDDDTDTDEEEDDEEEDDEEILTDKKDKLRYKIDLYNNCNKLRDNLKNNIITIDQFKDSIFDKCDTKLGIDVFRNI